MQRRTFSREFKTEAVKLVRERGVSFAQASRDLDVAEAFCAVGRGKRARIPGRPSRGMASSGQSSRRSRSCAGRWRG